MTHTSGARGRYVLVIDDDPIVAAVIESAVDMHAAAFRSMHEVEAKVDGLRPVAIFVDLDLAGQASLPWLPWLREQFAYIPIIVVTGSRDGDDLTAALARGADDFVRKPFDGGEIRARLEARIATRQSLRDVLIHRFRDLHLDRREGRVCGGQTCTFLSTKEALLLRDLIDARGTSVSRQRLATTGWGSLKVSRNSLDKCIQLLRRALRQIDVGVEIASDYGVGYRLRSTQSSDGMTRE